jgi:sugar/nucleoside kinase (ribokinase family)
MIRIHGTGCALIDFLYPRCDFNAPEFRARLSRHEGDGGLSIGRLVFAEEFERFAGKPYGEALAELTGGNSGPAEPRWNLGGPSVVALVHAAQMLGHRARVAFYGVRGDDPAGDLAEQALARLGFVSGEAAGQEPGAFYVMKRRGGLSPRTDVLSDPGYDGGHGERTFINLIGAAGGFGGEDLGEGFFRADIAAFGGTALTPQIHDSLTELLAAAKQQKALTVVNLVYDFRSEQAAPGSKWKLGKNDDAYPFIDLVIADRDEALKTSGAASPAEAAVRFLEKGCGAAIITEGNRPVHLASGKGIFSPLTPSTLPVSGAVNRELAAHPERRGDTTGCGDNFAGGVIAGVAEQLERQDGKRLDLREACIPGIVAGGCACFTLGGVFYEQRPGEKRELLAPFMEAYRNETAAPPRDAGL